MAIKINANMSNEHKQLLVSWIPRLIKCFSSFNCKLNVLEAYVGRAFAQFIVEDENKTRFNEFMTEKLTDVVNEEFGVKTTMVYPDFAGRDFTLGIEIPLEKRETVSFSAMAASKEYLESNAYTFVAGESVKGKNVCFDFTSEQRVLIGGMKNAGKTVFLHSMICSLLLKNGAEDLKLVLFDKNKVFNDYLDLPHLLFHGAIFDEYGAKEALEWLNGELDWRKVMFDRNGCRNLEEYNRYAEVANEDKFPAVLIVIDELADWADDNEVMKLFFDVLKKETAQLGVFFAVATQKPSIDYLGASLKELFPAKIVFRCDYPITSRIMFGKTYAVKLLGEGDMYYKDADNKIGRLQSPFITREDILDTLAKFDIRID